jgi:RTA1 like protein
MTLGRMIFFFDETKKFAGIRAHRFGQIFVGLDVVSFIVQASGASMTTNSSQSTVMLGIHIYMGGIGLQQLFILCFTIMLVLFYRKISAAESTSSNWERMNSGSMPWRWLFYGIYAALTMITVYLSYPLLERYLSRLHRLIK